MKNERNAGRKPKFTVPSKHLLIPVMLHDEVKKMYNQYLTKKNAK